MSFFKEPTLGVDLGGTKVETSLVDSSGQILASHRRPTNPEKGQDAVVDDIVACVQGCIGESGGTARALGIGVAGQVERETGKVRFAPNLGWCDVELRARLEQALSMRVVVANDVRAATFGEWRHGAGAGVDDMVCLFVGTGIGGGVISNGRLLEGCSNTAGEMGHITIVSGGRDCHCRNRGCLEAYAGGWAIAERAREAVETDPENGQILVGLAGSVKEISAATVAKAYADRNPLAVRLVEETAQYLAAGVTGIVNAFNPCLLILGGGVIDGIPEFISSIERTVRLNALEAAVDGTTIAKAALGNKAGVIGAAAMAREVVRDDT